MGEIFYVCVPKEFCLGYKFENTDIIRGMWIVLEINGKYSNIPLTCTKKFICDTEINIVL